MRARRPYLIAALAMAFAVALPTTQSRAATPGFHAAYFSESAFLSLEPGQTGQFSVGFTNVGDQTWQSGVLGRGAALHTAAPLDNTVDSSAGWASGWVAPNVYARQGNDTVPPGQVGFFTYNVAAPAGAAFGPHRFYGRLFIEGVGPLEDVGYYQVATLAPVSFTLAIDGTTPQSPTIVSQPLVDGHGAPAGATVTVVDGSATVGSGKADTGGIFHVLTSLLAPGTHSFSASATGGTRSAAFTYVLKPPSPGGSAGGTCDNPLVSLTRPGAYSLVVTFTTAVQPGPVTAPNFRYDSGTFPGATVPRRDGFAVRLDFPPNPPPTAGAHTIEIWNQLATNGTSLPSPISCSVTFASDETAPSLAGAIATTPTTIDVTFSESMRTILYYSANFIDDTARYTLMNYSDKFPATTTGIAGSGALIGVLSAATGAASNDPGVFGLSKATLTLTAPLAPNILYLLQVTNAQDQAGNALPLSTTTVVSRF